MTTNLIRIGNSVVRYGDIKYVQAIGEKTRVTFWDSDTILVDVTFDSFSKAMDLENLVKEEPSGELPAAEQTELWPLGSGSVDG